MNVSEPFIRRPVATTLLTIGVLTAYGAHEELAIHVEGALRRGDLTRDELGEAAAHLAMYAGWPKARHLALAILKVSERLGVKEARQPPVAQTRRRRKA